ncbi:MAG: TIGR04211 family SH3 domain-containing protein [Candidatus Competibacteraceae bacterium]|nr:MAG: TIGR04211 family SH3 domain-containing protein [Candidatus Competibacteraceae bacterium]
MKHLFLLLMLGTLAGPARAETVYATDSCTLPVRSGTSTEYRILRMVDSGTPLEILGSGTTQGYTRVRTPEGVAGWILTRYLMDQPSPRDQVLQLEERVAALDEDNRTLRDEAETLDATRAALARCEEELAAIRHAAAETLAIEQENLRLQQEIAAAHEQQRYLELENASLRDRSSRNWFIAGAGVALGGLLLGLIIPRISWRRRQRWDSL